MGPNIFKKIAKMSLELLGLLLELLLELLLLLLYAFYHVLIRPPVIHSTILIPGFGRTCSVRSSLGLLRMSRR